MKLIVALLLLATAISCTHDIENRSVVGETFPKVNGNSLSGKKWNLPGDFKAKKTLLLIGYEQNTQFDIDRWLVALDDRKVKVDLYEIPTVAGLVPYLIADKIDEGMKSGIPRELWPIVITVYKDADKIIKFTGNENALNARILLLDATHKVIFQHDRGFSVSKLSELISLIKL